MLETTTAVASLDAATLSGICAFLGRLDGRYIVRASILFGSRARGTHHAESDADLAVFLEGDVTGHGMVARDMAGIAFDAMLETGVLVDPHPVLQGTLDATAPDGRSTLLRWLRRDGVRVAREP